MYNCHGLVFASHRTQVDDNSIQMILDDDSYEEVKIAEVLPGDVIVYLNSDGDITHSGIVVEKIDAPLFIRVCSKWGKGPEILHAFGEVPSIYGSNHKFYRCRL